MQTWRFLNDGAHDGDTNMAIDEALLLGVNKGSTRPTIRVYSWDPPTVSVGYSQALDAELDVEACHRAGAGVVRRPTGGRAVFHAGELTYSVIAPSGTPPIGTSIMEAYSVIANALLAGLRLLGVEAELASVAPLMRGRDGGASPPCFVSSGRYEIVVGGRKLVGSAQRRVGGGMLQHGSILVDATHEKLADFLLVESESRRGVVRRLLSSKTTDLTTLLSRPVSLDEVASAIMSGFDEAWGLTLTEGELSEDEIGASRMLATECRVTS